MDSVQRKETICFCCDAIRKKVTAISGAVVFSEICWMDTWKWTDGGFGLSTAINNERFRLVDGKSIVIQSACGQTFELKCRFVDETHCEVGRHLYHISQFAEKMEKNGPSVFSKEIPLPRYCFGSLPSTGEIIKITRYEKGYTPLKVHPIGAAGAEGAERLNASIGVSKGQAAAMFAGSLFGWDCPAAKEEQYDDDGNAISVK